MKKIRCLLVDDEPLAIRLIEKHIANMEQLEVVATCNTAIKAFEILHSQEIDLLFLDIKMPAMTGIDFLKTLKHPPPTIFTTAYRNYALESYDLQVVDYLLKPITFERFLKSVERFLKHYTPKASSSVQPAVVDESMIIKSGNKHHKVFLKDILYIESLKDYVKIHTIDKRIVAKFKMGDIEEKLGQKNFIRVHRSYIVHLRQVTAFTTYDIEIGETEIPIGASYKTAVMAALNKGG